MDDIIKKVIEKLLERENSVLTYNYNAQNSYAKSIFLDHQTIQITEMNAVILEKIVSLEDHPFVSWILDGIDYGVDFHFYLSTSIIQLIPLELLIKWPIKIYNKNNQRIIACPKKAITYKEMMSLPNETILIKTKSQIITDLALEVEQKKQIEIIERF